MADSTPERQGPVCTNCGAPMVSRSCKVRCRRCGYFEDCSDTGLPAYTVHPKTSVVTDAGTRDVPAARNT